ncbi:hypothetical protein B4589_001475 [Halolamina sp. CBA1230]|uniref:hypothetical protein n=1 Tax=Halolamina sp. CBA1230 TaxID=1853690 RepID=UPI0009A13BE3|nr:hypothetical protein [Halolamina sp. CBA1230]QKY19109.1 hypothetical protein B4589_001475 [Halolamina sp. CBA1230]
MSDSVDVPADAAAVAGRYHRLERLVSGGVAVGIALAGAAAFLLLPPLWALVPIVALVVLARAPVFRSGGRARLRTDADPASVREAFAGATPPPLALQWGIADDVRTVEGGVVYDLSYLFGLRTVELRVEAEVVENVTEPDRVELTATVDGQPWGTYTAWVEPVEGGTGITVEVQSDRKFGLRRIPQYLIVRRYRDAAIEAQGYEVVERSFSLST